MAHDPLELIPLGLAAADAPLPPPPPPPRSGRTLTITSGTTIQTIPGSLDDVADATTVSCWLEEADGFETPETAWLSTAGPRQQGETDLDFRLKPRTIQLALGFMGRDDIDLETKRQTLLRLFKPQTRPLQLRVDLPDGAARQIDCRPLGKPGVSRFGRYQRLVVSLRAADPLWYDPIPWSVAYMLGGSAGWTVPMLVPLNVGASALNVAQTLFSAGDFREQPIVTIYGPITSPVITNVTTGQKLDLTGTTLGTGVIYEIDTRYGAGTVIEDPAGARINRIDRLSDDSDLTGFAIESDPDAPGGANLLLVTGSATTSATQIILRGFQRYTGV